MSHSFDRRRFHTLALTALAGTSAPAAWAQQANARPLRVLLPVGAGSGVDTIIRAVAPALGKALNQPVVVENLPGAGGIVGTQAIVKAPADGSVIGIVSNNHATNPAVYSKMPYDALADITPISALGGTPFLLVVNPTRMPVGHLGEFVALLRSKGSALNYASSGNGTILHLAAALVVDAAGAQATHVPYKAVGPMLTDLIGGQVDFGVLPVNAVAQHLQRGTLRAIAVTSGSRVRAFPDLPTLGEQGLTSATSEGWFAAIGPARLPASEVRRVLDGFKTAFATPEVIEAMTRQGNQIQPMTPEATQAFMKSEMERYGGVIRKIGLKLD